MLYIRDLTKFDDRYEERYLHTRCEGYLATYDNLPIVDSRIWSKDGKTCELRLIKQVANIEASEDNEAVLLLKLTFADKTEGKVILSEESIDFEIGVLSYCWGIPTEETDLAFAGNCLKGSQNGFAYEMPIIGNVVRDGEGFLWQPENGKLSLQLDVRV